MPNVPADAEAVLGALNAQFAAEDGASRPKLHNAPRDRYGTRRDIWIHIRATAREKRILTTKAHDRGLTLAAFLLTTGLKARHASRDILGKSTPLGEDAGA